MKALVIAALMAASLGLGCAKAHLYPVKGPLSAQTPPQVFSAKMTAAFYSGTFTTALANGEVFKAHMERVPRDPAATSKNLSAEWDTVYGVGFYNLRVLEAQFYLRGETKGTRGTLLTVEMYKNETRTAIASKDAPNDLELKGVARDDKGNIYRVAFK